VELAALRPRAGGGNIRKISDAPMRVHYARFVVNLN